MDRCHEHNRSKPASDAPRTWGIRLSLPENDPMRAVLGDDWHQFEWFATEQERDRKLAQLTGHFVYYRRGDRPSFRLEKVTRGQGPDPQHD
ncbi:MAG: hypothetical protein P8080_00250 [Gammaproteobacteria bacterium]